MKSEALFDGLELGYDELLYVELLDSDGLETGYNKLCDELLRSKLKLGTAVTLGWSDCGVPTVSFLDGLELGYDELLYVELLDGDGLEIGYTELCDELLRSELELGTAVTLGWSDCGVPTVSFLDGLELGYDELLYVELLDGDGLCDELLRRKFELGIAVTLGWNDSGVPTEWFWLEPRNVGDGDLLAINDGYELTRADELVPFSVLLLIKMIGKLAVDE
jgi:hypothetical protein